MKQRSLIYSILFTGLTLSGCNKLIEIGTPRNQLVTASVFTDTVTVESAVLGLYSKLANGSPGMDPGTATSLYNGLSADEGYHYSFTFYDDFKNNSLNANVYYLDSYWSGFYNIIYTANALIQGDSASSSLPAPYKARTIAEARFVRAVCYFYLVNEYGAVPLVLTPNVNISNTQPRDSATKIYDQIEKDLTGAAAALPADLGYYAGKRTRATSWAAKALLARVYLYRNKWSQAAATAGSVINNPGLFSINPDPTKVFLANNQEGLLQFVNAITSSWMATSLGASPFAVTPNFVLGDSLYASFEANDLRKTNWVGIKKYGNTNYPFPSKYKYIGGQGAVEYAQLLRMSEQYLIRAEANTQLGQFSSAAADLDIVRARAGLPNTTAADKPSLITAIEHERRTEFFCEWGHRWLDLKRWPGIANPSATRADEVLSAAKSSNWQSTDALYPIPQPERNVNPNLTQNPGYN
ncbi:MAG: RagB/SusD family nutrient uptake outer membrane protein [Bacteroidetes bacterium]|nr:RagB/SusD family nutrient uptake outer membrane protein [Bacteroidota bacterium]